MEKEEKVQFQGLLLFFEKSEWKFYSRIKIKPIILERYKLGYNISKQKLPVFVMTPGVFVKPERLSLLSKFENPLRLEELNPATQISKTQ